MSNEIEPKECIIFLNEITNETGFVYIKCKHPYCAICFAKHMRVDNKCAICRVVLLEEPKSSIDDDDNLTIPYDYDNDPYNFFTELLPVERDNIWVTLGSVVFGPIGTQIPDITEERTEVDNTDEIINNAINSVQLYNLFRGGLPPYTGSRVNNTHRYLDG